MLLLTFLIFRSLEGGLDCPISKRLVYLIFSFKIKHRVYNTVHFSSKYVSLLVSLSPSPVLTSLLMAVLLSCHCAVGGLGAMVVADVVLGVRLPVGLCCWAAVAFSCPLWIA